ncbi:hypothetical protein Hs30E_20450 [Lactococcus hodotermopsidis]|uniref:Uncharacterized protein n=1 Tax=Pseudolactococcus hodotermopsidis TaxID=2709157 RepID=A0A6A0BFH6_9LACT|nr:Imm59 family immunity protein [Lactococcus hodotermopsidis]GFH43516.1 hypothetical protein Hs30E_20450 [Lactococcus hodotermopsidis]
MEDDKLVQQFQKLEEYKEIIEQDIELLKYQDVRYSIFAGENNNRQDYQLRIERVEEHFEVFMTADRAGIMGKYKFDDFLPAYNKFMSILQSIVLSNRRSVKDGEKPEYSSPLWNK